MIKSKIIVSKEKKHVSYVQEVSELKKYIHTMYNSNYVALGSSSLICMHAWLIRIR